MMTSFLRRRASGLLKSIYRLTQAVSRNAVDNHIENYIVD